MWICGCDILPSCRAVFIIFHKCFSCHVSHSLILSFSWVIPIKEIFHTFHRVFIFVNSQILALYRSLLSSHFTETYTLWRFFPCSQQKSNDEQKEKENRGSGRLKSFLAALMNQSPVVNVVWTTNIYSNLTSTTALKIAWNWFKVEITLEETITSKQTWLERAFLY